MSASFYFLWVMVLRTALFPFGVIYGIPLQGAAQFFLLNGKKNVSLQGEINTKASA